MNPLLDAALSYASRGWQVFPCYGISNGRCECGKKDCASPGKHPRIDNGVKGASSDAATITTWWATWPNANVAIATGAESGIFVIDLDRKKGKDGIKAFAALGASPPTATVKTPSGGLHLYFKHPGGRIANSASKLGPGIDVRGDGGYVMAPPSKGPDDSLYT